MTPPPSLHLDKLTLGHDVEEACANAERALRILERASRPFTDWRDAYQTSYGQAMDTFARRQERVGAERSDRLPLDSRRADVRIAALETALGMAPSRASVAAPATHSVLFEGFRQINPGELRTSPLRLGPQYAADLPYVQTIEPERIAASLAELESALEVQAAGHPLISICILYAGMILIHPFQDGNGRTARTLMDAALATSGLLVRPIFSLEAVLRTHDRENGYRLTRLHEEGDWTPLIHFLARALTLGAEMSRHAFEATITRSFAATR